MRQERIEAGVVPRRVRRGRGFAQDPHDLREDGETISRKTVAKVMRGLGLRGVCPKRWLTTTILEHTDTYPDDVVQRKWDTGALNQVWVGDISYLRTWEG